VCDSTCKSSKACSSDSKPAMSYISEALDKVKEKITEIFQKEESRYKKLVSRYWQAMKHISHIGNEHQVSGQILASNEAHFSYRKINYLQEREDNWLLNLT